MSDQLAGSIFSALLNTPNYGVRNASNLNSVRSKFKIPVDIVSDEKTIYIYGELPGIDKKDLVLDVYNNKITIQCKKNRSYGTPEKSEINYGEFETVIILPICVTKKETVTPTYENGVLKIKIDKLIEEQNKFSVKLT
jgi:HSP20 family protein